MLNVPEVMASCCDLSWLNLPPEFLLQYCVTYLQQADFQRAALRARQGVAAARPGPVSSIPITVGLSAHLPQK